MIRIFDIKKYQVSSIMILFQVVYHYQYDTFGMYQYQ